MNINSGLPATSPTIRPTSSAVIPAVGLRIVPNAGWSGPNPVRERTPRGPCDGPGNVFKTSSGMSRATSRASWFSYMSNTTAPAIVCSRSDDVTCPSGWSIILSGKATCSRPSRPEASNASTPAWVAVQASRRDPFGGLLMPLVAW